MSYPAHEIQGAIDSLGETITTNAATFTAAGLTPVNVKAALVAQGTIITQKDTAQENAKAALKTATIQYNIAADNVYKAFSSTVDLLIGAAGKGTPLAKQIQAIRTKLTTTKQSSGGGGSSSSSSSSSSTSDSGGGGSSSSS